MKDKKNSQVQNVKANKKITKLSDLIQIDGKVEDLDEKGHTIPTTLDDILGRNSLIGNKFGAQNRGEYEQLIASMNEAELRTHAVKLGFIPSRDKNRLKRQLFNEFDRFIGGFVKPRSVNSNANLSEKKLKIAMDIMKAAK